MKKPTLKTAINSLRSAKSLKRIGVALHSATLERFQDVQAKGRAAKLELAVFDKKTKRLIGNFFAKNRKDGIYLRRTLRRVIRISKAGKAKFSLRAA